MMCFTVHYVPSCAHGSSACGDSQCQAPRQTSTADFAHSECFRRQSLSRPAVPRITVPLRPHPHLMTDRQTLESACSASPSVLGCDSNSMKRLGNRCKVDALRGPHTFCLWCAGRLLGSAQQEQHVLLPGQRGSHGAGVRHPG
jgi:hypothetical protein